MAVQQRVLLHGVRAVAKGCHWLTIDAWMAEQAALDAAAGHGAANTPLASPWNTEPAEFEITGSWFRLEHRRPDERRGVVKPQGDVDLMAELRILACGRDFAPTATEPA